MNFSTETLLIIGIIGFYLYDSAILAFSNELIFNESYGRWTVTFPKARWRLMGKLLFIPNPFTPDDMIYRASWSTNEKPLQMEDGALICKLKKSLLYLRIAVIILLVMLVIVFPVVMIKYGTGIELLEVIVLIYLTIISMLAYTFIKKEDLCLNKKAFFSLALDSLACPPFAINILRKISLRTPLCINSIEFAKQTLHPEVFKSFIESLANKVSEELECEDEEDNPRAIELINFHKKLLGMMI
jgi:hypothetical protein